MKARFELTILQPQISACSENWDAMLPHEKGAFCLSCNKVVHNFENLNSEQLVNFLLKNVFAIWNEHQRYGFAGSDRTARYLSKNASMRV